MIRITIPKSIVTCAIHYIVCDSDDIKDKYESILGKRSGINSWVDTFDNISPPLLRRVVETSCIVHRNCMNSLVKASNSLTNGVSGYYSEIMRSTNKLHQLQNESLNLLQDMTYGNAIINTGLLEIQLIQEIESIWNSLFRISMECANSYDLIDTKSFQSKMRESFVGSFKVAAKNIHHILVELKLVVEDPDSHEILSTYNYSSELNPIRNRVIDYLPNIRQMNTAPSPNITTNMLNIAHALLDLLNIDKYGTITLYNIYRFDNTIDSFKLQMTDWINPKRKIVDENEYKKTKMKSDQTNKEAEKKQNAEKKKKENEEALKQKEIELQKKETELNKREENIVNEIEEKIKNKVSLLTEEELAALHKEKKEKEEEEKKEKEKQKKKKEEEDKQRLEAEEKANIQKQLKSKNLERKKAAAFGSVIGFNKWSQQNIIAPWLDSIKGKTIMLIEDRYNTVTKIVFGVIKSHIMYDLFKAELNNQLRISKNDDLHDNIVGDSIQTRMIRCMKDFFAQELHFDVYEIDKLVKKQFVISFDKHVWYKSDIGMQLKVATDKYNSPVQITCDSEDELETYLNIQLTENKQAIVSALTTYASSIDKFCVERGIDIGVVGDDDIQYGSVTVTNNALAGVAFAGIFGGLVYLTLKKN